MAPTYVKVTYRDIAGVEATETMRLDVAFVDALTNGAAVLAVAEDFFAALITMSEAKIVKTELIIDLSAIAAFVDGEIPGEFCNVADYAFVRTKDSADDLKSFRIFAPDMTRYDHLPSQQVKGSPNWDTDIALVLAEVVDVDSGLAMTHQFSQLRNRKRWKPVE